MSTSSVDASRPRSAAERLEFVDSLRGFALFGVFWANLLIFSGFTYLTEEQRASLFGGPVDRLAYVIEQFFVQFKFVGLFSFLFGISFWLFLSRNEGRGPSRTTMFYRRIFWLFVIGAIHGWLFWAFDILRFYALWGLLLPLFMRTPPRLLLGLALTACVLGPAVVSGAEVLFTRPVAAATDYDAMALAAFSGGTYSEFLAANWRYDWYLTNSISEMAIQLAIFGRLLLGLYVARALDLRDLGRHRILLRRVLLAGGAAGLVGNTIFAGSLLTAAADSPWLAFIRRFLVESGHLGLTLAYASALALAFLAARWRRAIRVFAPVGQMALTWYLLQTAFGIWMFYGFARGPALMGDVGPAWVVAIGLLGFGVQIALARAWMSRFRFGPAEWCWRSLTYGKIQPFRLRPPGAAAGSMQGPAPPAAVDAGSQAIRPDATGAL